MNETSANDSIVAAQVDSDSIFRVASISKNIAALSTLVVENESKTHGAFPVLSPGSPVRQALPEFGLPEKDWQNGGSDITLSMLATHSSGIPREGYLTDFNMVVGVAKADAETIEYATYNILERLNMTHTFFGAIPDALVPSIGVPGGPNWVDLVIGPGYDPAGGMWPRLILPDGKQQVGYGWEIATTDHRTKSYNIYGKSGDAGGFHSWLDVVPNLGYGIVVLSQESQPAGSGYTRVSPTTVRDNVHAILLPAFVEALASRLERRYAGRYARARDGGAIADEVAKANGSAAAGSFARLEVENGALFVRELSVNGTSAWEGLDRLGWTAESQARFFSTASGVSLHPAEGAGEGAEFSDVGMPQVWRVIPDSETCDWYDFDG
ncbi:hypothetical protein SLS55_000724 [Diplodia seriata]|uniref:Beta-lactamase-related domain-containing protein n=1 Tax=Diplodia seriata TaxID=420778 RepID=A0ABR3CV51_9PEZI